MRRLFLVLFAFLSVSLAAQNKGAGYKGLAELNLGFSSGPVFVEASTTHGAVFADMFFIGAGLGLGFCSDQGEYYGNIYVPVFLDARFMFPGRPDRRPYLGCRAACAYLDGMNSFPKYSFFAGMQLREDLAVQLRTTLHSRLRAESAAPLTAIDLGVVYNF